MTVLDLTRPEFVQAHLRKQEFPVEAVPTPLPAWNRHCRDAGGGVGLALGWHVTVAANTGAGKSLLALNLAAHAMGQGHSVGFLSLEMGREQLATRLLAILTATPVRDLERGEAFDRARADETAGKVAELREETGARFLVTDEQVYHPDDVLQYLERFVELEARLIVVDYLQLLAARDADSLFSSVSNVSAYIREFARARNVVTVGLSQFNRPTSAAKKERPTVQGLMGSSSLENDSDQVLLLDHSRYERDASEDNIARTWAILGKNRHGSSGEIPVEWDYRTLRIRQALPDEEHLWPGAPGR